MLASRQAVDEERELVGATYLASARAVQDCTAVGWDERMLTGLMEQFPRLALNALQLLAGQLQTLPDSYRELATERVTRRVARALLRLVRQTGRRVGVTLTRRSEPPARLHRRQDGDSRIGCAMSPFETPAAVAAVYSIH